MNRRTDGRAQPGTRRGSRRDLPAPQTPTHRPRVRTGTALGHQVLPLRIPPGRRPRSPAGLPSSSEPGGLPSSGHGRESPRASCSPASCGPRVGEPEGQQSGTGPGRGTRWSCGSRALCPHGRGHSPPAAAAASPAVSASGSTSALRPPSCPPDTQTLPKTFRPRDWPPPGHPHLRQGPASRDTPVPSQGRRQAATPTPEQDAAAGTPLPVGSGAPGRHTLQSVGKRRSGGMSGSPVHRRGVSGQRTGTRGRPDCDQGSVACLAL